MSDEEIAAGIAGAYADLADSSVPDALFRAALEGMRAGRLAAENGSKA